MTSTTNIPLDTEVVIIGGGVVGCSIAYHLSKKKIDTVLLERKSLTCGTTWHAAGLVGQLRSSKNLTMMAKYSTELYCELDQIENLSTGMVQNGSISIAENNERLEELRRSASMGKHFGLEVEEISLDEIKSLYPLINLDGVKGGFHLPKDGQINPVDITMCLAKEFKRMGGKIIEQNAVTGFEQDDNKIKAVHTELGTIKCKKIVISSGMWSREVGKMCGVNIPLHACEHFYALTEYSDEIIKNLPILRAPDSQIYIKEDAGKLLIGAFEEKAKPWGMNGIPKDFEFDSLPNDLDHFGPTLMNAMERLPILNDLGIQTYFNGPESFTPDDRYYLGKVPYKENIFVSTGFNSIGVQSAGGVGKVMADWIVNDMTEMDLWDVDVSRVLDFQNNEEYLRERSTESLGLLYKIHWPYYQYETSRNQIKSPLHHLLENNGACFGETAGWERANWFAESKSHAKYDYSYGKQNWFENVRSECLNVRNNVGVFDLTSFSKFIIEGKDALSFLNFACVSQMNVPIGKIVYTQMLNPLGGTEADITITRIEEEKFFYVTSPTSHNKDFYWLENLSKKYKNVSIIDVTQMFGCLSVMGPNARQLIQSVVNDDISNEQIPFGYSKKVRLKNIECRLNRLTYVGEQGFEIYVPKERLVVLFHCLYGKESQFEPRLSGYHALNSLRMEKGYLHWGHDVTIEENPYQAGVGFCIDLKKETPFNGQAAIEKSLKKGLKKRKLNFCLDENDKLMYHNEPIFFKGDRVGEISSGMYGFYLDKSLAMGYISAVSNDMLNNMIKEKKFEIEIAGIKYIATGSKECFYDPKRDKILN